MERKIYISLRVWKTKKKSVNVCKIKRGYKLRETKRRGRKYRKIFFAKNERRLCKMGSIKKKRWNI